MKFWCTFTNLCVLEKSDTTKQTLRSRVSGVLAYRLIQQQIPSLAGPQSTCQPFYPKMKELLHFKDINDKTLYKM